MLVDSLVHKHTPSLSNLCLRHGDSNLYLSFHGPIHPVIHPPLFPGRPERGWPSPGRCTAGSWVLHISHPCRKPERRCRGPAERGNPPRRPGGRRKTNRGWKRMGWGSELTTATPSWVPLQPAPYENNENWWRSQGFWASDWLKHNLFLIWEWLVVLQFYYTACTHFASWWSSDN